MLVRKIMAALEIFLHFVAAYLLTLIVAGWPARPTVEEAVFWAVAWVYVPFLMWKCGWLTVRI